MSDKKRMLAEGEFHNTLISQINSIEDRLLLDLNRKANSLGDVISKFKENMSNLTPEIVESIITLGVDIGKGHLTLLNDIGIADLPKIEAIRLNLTSIRKSFNDLDLLAKMLNKKRSDAKFSTNAFNGQQVGREKDMPKRIKEADDILKKIDDSLIKIISSLTDFNKDIELMKFDLSGLSIKPRQEINQNEYRMERESVYDRVDSVKAKSM